MRRERSVGAGMKMVAVTEYAVRSWSWEGGVGGMVRPASEPRQVRYDSTWWGFSVLECVDDEVVGRSARTKDGGKV
jgi:hypothetical protein